MTKIIVKKPQVIQIDQQKEISSISNSMFNTNQIKINTIPLGSSFRNQLTTFISLISNNTKSDKHSQPKLNLVKVKPEIGEAKLKNLAEVCYRSEKSVLLNLPHTNELPQINKPITWTIKRALDWLAALFILLILSPVMSALAVIIATTSSGSIFFHQWRVGEGGKLFRIIKFRTMITDADKLHHLVMTGQTGLHKCEDDPRITNVGRWMRKYSLDELPQLFNVLRGEMSLVGPRPWALYDALRINGDRKRRLNSLPGVTGAWQVSARSTMLDLDAVTECDLSYLRHWTLWSDLKILFMTVPKVLSGFGAY
jgi:lipopolysaccharide/colanic/teichoic acid biosynthesis glycosyltransferase